MDVLLLRDVERRFVQLVSLRDQDLALDQVDAGDDFGHRVLDLDARVHFDEEEFVLVEVEQELDGAGVAIVDRLAQPHGRVADVFAQLAAAG